MENNTNTLDLHGLTHRDADTIVEDWIGKNEPPYTIITGNSLKMKQIVTNKLDRYQFKWLIWQWNTGAIRVLE